MLSKFLFTSATYWMHIISNVTRSQNTTGHILPAESKLWLSFTVIGFYLIKEISNAGSVKWKQSKTE